MGVTTIELAAPMPYDTACAECGKPVVLVLTIRDWSDNHQGFPTEHLLCLDCAIALRTQLGAFISDIRHAVKP